MKKKFRFALVVCAAMAALCSCTNDELVDQSGNGTGNGALTFNMQVKNRTRTRAEATALQSTHYEFGVSGFAESVSGENAYMQNYLVAYADPSDTKYKPWADANVATTWGDNNSILNGNSYWVYEKLGSADITGKATKSAYANQYLRYWDETTDNSYFFAYAPYNYKTINESLESGHKVTLNNVSSFYTQPVVQMTGAVSTGLMKDGTYASAEPLTEDRDIINANEVIYAATTVTKANYGNDVPFEFKHANAQIRLAFYTDITSYDVTLTDLVPEEISGISQQTGVVLTPANEANKTYVETPSPTTQPTPNTEFVTGYNALTITNGASLGWGTAATSNANLLFKVPDPTLSTSKLSTTPSELTYLPTIYYAVPAPASNTCGFTVHVSYKLKSKATGTDDQIQLYDARVWVPANNCKWAAGNTYTYIFKITDKSSGTTDPQREDPATPGEPYIDPSDPRVIETGELHPIEFTAMVLTDFDEIYDGLFNISNELKTKPLTEGADNILYTEFATYGKHDLIGYTIISPENENMFTLGSITYDKAAHTFKLPCTAAAPGTTIPLAALSYTNIKTSDVKNTAFTYVYTNNEGTKAIKITATEKSEGPWEVITDQVQITSNIYAHAIYIKDLGNSSYDNAIVGQSIPEQVYEFDGSKTFALTPENYTQDGISLLSSYDEATTKRKITLSGTPTKAGFYTFTFTEQNLGRKFTVTVKVDNPYNPPSTSPSKTGDDTYQYTTSYNYNRPTLPDYNIISPSNVITEVSDMAWSYSEGTFTLSNGTGEDKHIMKFANLGATGADPYIAFWVDENNLEIITYKNSVFDITTMSNTGTNPAYTIFKK